MVTEAASGGRGGALMLSGFCYYSDIYVFIIIILYHIFVIVLQSVILS